MAALYVMSCSECFVLQLETHRHACAVDWISRSSRAFSAFLVWNVSRLHLFGSICCVTPSSRLVLLFLRHRRQCRVCFWAVAREIPVSFTSSFASSRVFMFFLSFHNNIHSQSYITSSQLLSSACSTFFPSTFFNSLQQPLTTNSLNLMFILEYHEIMHLTQHTQSASANCQCFMDY